MIPLLAFLLSPSTQAAEFLDEIQRDFAIRTMGQLQVTNLRGGITIRGWSQDKIRVVSKRRVEAETEEEAAVLRKALDLRFVESGREIELSAQYGGGLALEQRLRERQNPKSSMELVVLAPITLSLRIWAVDGAVIIEGWKGALDIRTAKGSIRVSDVESGAVSMLCPYCEISARNIRGSLRSIGGVGQVSLTDISGDQIYVETSAGDQHLERIRGEEQLYVSKSGNIIGKRLQGAVEFHSTTGSVQIASSTGFISGSSETGGIDIEMLEWKFKDKALLETLKGAIRLRVPALFSGEVELRSLTGKTRTDFKVASEHHAVKMGPMPANHLRGRVGKKGGEQLNLYSQSGDISLEKIH